MEINYVIYSREEVNKYLNIELTEYNVRLFIFQTGDEIEQNKVWNLKKIKSFPDVVYVRPCSVCKFDL